MSDVGRGGGVDIVEVLKHSLVSPNIAERRSYLCVIAGDKISVSPGPGDLSGVERVPELFAGAWENSASNIELGFLSQILKIQSNVQPSRN